MNNSQIIFKRVMELKKLSNQLKQSTSKPQKVDYSIIRDIITATQNYTRYQSQPNLKTLSPQQSPRNNKIDPILKRLFSQRNEINTFDDEKIQPLFKERSNLNVNKSKQQIKPVVNDQDLIKLKTQNIELEKTISSLKVQLKRYKEMENQMIQRQYTRIPYFSYQQKLLCFVTKIQINEEDYDKIEYSQCEANLDLQKLTLTKNGKLKKQLNLGELFSVKYKNNSIVLQFQQQNSKSIENLFLSFSNQSDLEHWDLGIYINFTILRSMQKKQKLFQGLFVKSPTILKKQSSRSSIQQSQSMNSNIGNKELLKTYKQKKSQLNELTKIINSKLIEKLLENKKQHIQEQQNQFLDQAPSKVSVSPSKINTSPSKISEDYLSKSQNMMIKKSQSIDIEENNHNNHQNINNKQMGQQIKQSKININLEQKQRTNNLDKIADIIQQQVEAQQRNEQSQQHRSTITMKQKEQQQLKKQQERKIRQQKQKQQKIKQLEEKRILQEQRQKQEEERKENQDRQKLNQAIINLQGSYTFTKYAQKGWQPRTKKVYLSNDRKFLCLQDTKNLSDIKQHLISDIDSVDYMEIGKGIMKYGKKPIMKDNYSVIKIKDKIIELGTTNSPTMLQFTDSLINVLESLK